MATLLEYDGALEESKPQYLRNMVVVFTMPQGGGDPYIGDFEIVDGMVVSPDGKYRQSLKELLNGFCIRSASQTLS